MRDTACVGRGCSSTPLVASEIEPLHSAARGEGDSSAADERVRELSRPHRQAGRGHTSDARLTPNNIYLGILHIRHNTVWCLATGGNTQEVKQASCNFEVCVGATMRRGLLAPRRLTWLPGSRRDS